MLTGDPSTIANIHPLTGVLSNLGVLLWCSSAAICLFSSVVLHHTASWTTGCWFLLWSALLTCELLFDDLFLVHEVLAPRYLGLSQHMAYVVLGGATAAYLLMFRRVILQSEYTALCLALVFFAISVAMDAMLAEWLRPLLGHWTYFVEDGAKFLGLASWFSYYAWVSYQFLIDRPSILPDQGLEATPSLGERGASYGESL